MMSGRSIASPVSTEDAVSDQSLRGGWPSLAVAHCALFIVQSVCFATSVCVRVNGVASRLT